jgi:hypothetical protein
MSKAWAIFTSITVALLGAAIAYRGFTTDGWLGGLLLGVLIPAGVIYEWLALRDAEPKLAADRLALAFVLVMLILASDALDLIESEIFGRI